MNLLCCGYADWIDGLTVYSVAALTSADWTDLQPTDRVLKQCGHLFKQTHIMQTPSPRKHSDKMHQYKTSKEGEGKGNGRRVWIKLGIILIEGVHTLKQKGGWMQLVERQQRGRGWMTYCCFSHEAGFQPLFDAIQVQVDADQAQFPSPFDQLVRLHHKSLQEEDEQF